MIRWITRLLTILILTFAAGACSTVLNGPSVNPSKGLGSSKNAKQAEHRYKHAKNLWVTLASRFQLSGETASNPAVKKQIQWYLDNPLYLQTVVNQAKPYLFYIYQQVKARGLPPELVLMPMVESAYDPFAINPHSGATGLWQMMPGTASGFGLRVDWWYDGRRDIAASTSAALDYIDYLGDFFDKQWLLAIAAYNAGEGTVRQAVKHNKRLGKPTDFWHLDLSHETKRYVPKILALATIIKHPDRYPINLPKVKQAPYLAEVNMSSQIDLIEAAEMANMDLKRLAQLNPGYNRWATDPHGSNILLLPVTKVDHFIKELKKHPASERVTWYRIRVQKGDSLAKIASKYDTSVELLKQINRLNTTRLYPGEALLVPSDQKKITSKLLKKIGYFNKKLHDVPDSNVIHYRVKQGDSLSNIAKHFDVSVHQIKFWNKLSSKTIHKGQNLVIWPPEGTNFNPTVKTKVYTVKPGDSIYQIAHHNHASSKSIKRINQLDNNVIHPGQTLHIPLSHSSNEQDEILTKKAIEKQQNKEFHIPHQNHKQSTNSNNTVMTTYQVQKGDSLYSIAKQFNVSIKAIQHTNHLETDVIQPGRVLHIPQKGNKTRRQHHYKVQQGDSLWHIAQNLNVTVDQLERWNHLDGNSTLQPGDELTYFQAGGPKQHAANSKSPRQHKTQQKHTDKQSAHKLTYQVKKGDSLWQIANQLQVSVKQLKQWNNLHDNTTLNVGQKLIYHKPDANSKHAHSQTHNSQNTYKVKQGDSLWKIAHHLGVSVKQLKRLNNLSDSSTLHPGQKLTYKK